jgi:two-component system OmpR family sensor kinase
MRTSAMRTRRPRRPQLRTRVLAGVLAITVVGLVAFDVAAVTALRRYLVSQTDGQLHTVLSLYRPLDQAVVLSPDHSVARSAVVKPALGNVAIIGPRLRLPTALGQYSVEFVSGHGLKAFVQGGPNLRPPLPTHVVAGSGWQGARTVTSLNGRAQLRVQAMRAAGGSLVATTNLADVTKTVDRLQLIVIVGSAAAALLVGAGVAWIMRRGLRPIETMAAQADRISAGDLTDRVSPRDPQTEMGRLGTALNGMLARIEASVHEREAGQELTRRFFADASHELRNPLASLRANAELYQQGALPHRSQVDEAMRRIALEAQRMSGLIGDMLRLARLDQHPVHQDDQVDLTALVTGCAERAQITGPRRTWNTAIVDGLATAGDEELLRRAIDNLVANVRAHTPDDTATTITAARHRGTVTVEVSDDGPGVPASQLPRIFDRFYHAPAHRPGSGLGLAIVTAIATAHHGTARATLNDPHGLRITLTLPAGSQPGPAASSMTTIRPASSPRCSAPFPPGASSHSAIRRATRWTSRSGPKHR